MSGKAYKPVNPYKTRLDENNAYHMALCAEAIYEKVNDGSPDEPKILELLKANDDRYLSVSGFQAGGTEAALIEHDDYLVYSFRGTDEAVDWISNLNAFPDECLGGKYHRGFYQAFDRVWPELNEAYWAKRRERRRPVFLTGHSLGGALATCCAAWFNYKDWPYMGLYTFGSPRCVEKHTSRVFNMECRDKTYRFQNSSDIVTRMPSRAMGYSHTGINLFMDKDGLIQTDPGFWARFVDFVSVSAEDLLNVDLSTIANHDMSEYRDHINSWQLES